MVAVGFEVPENPSTVLPGFSETSNPAPRGAAAPKSKQRKGKRGKRGAYKERLKTQADKAKFLECYIEWPSIYRACVHAKVIRERVYAWLERDPAFAQAFEAAQKAAVDVLVGDMMKRGREKSDQVGIFLLKKLDPRFRDEPKVAAPDPNVVPPLALPGDKSGTVTEISQTTVTRVVQQLPDAKLHALVDNIESLFKEIGLQSEKRPTVIDVTPQETPA